MKSTNTIYHHATVTRERRNQLNNHKSVVLWFTGLSGSGKSTMSHALEERLFNKGCMTFVIDGDNVRHGLNSHLGFSDKDRKENIRRIGEVKGMAVLEDILEEIVGQFTSNQGETIEEINQQKDGSYLVDPRISIRELNKALKIKLPYDSAKTLNGLILENLQSFPQHNLSLKIEPLIIEIVQVSKQGVKLVRINKIY